MLGSAQPRCGSSQNSPEPLTGLGRSREGDKEVGKGREMMQPNFLPSPLHEVLD